MLTRSNEQIRGFTLIEMSIVLTIISLLVGGVMIGGTMLRQTQVNSIMTDLRNYTTAMSQFQDKYGVLPGDMANATSYWGAAGSPTNTWAGCYSIVGTGTQTCDGNGDGQINAPGGIYAEEYRAWQHLALAGMIKGSYNGVNAKSDGTTTYDVTGTNVPKGPMDNTGYDIVYIGNNGGTASPYTTWGPINFGHAILFGTPPGTWRSQSPALTAIEQASLDQKYDDGLPFSGIISMGYIGFNGSCATSPYTAASTYNFIFQGRACSMTFVTGF